MYFGGSSFASSPFGDPGGVSVFINLTGNQVNLATGTVGTVAKAKVVVSGNSATITIGNVTTKVDITAPVTGNQFTVASGDPFVVLWNPIDPNATGVWVPIDPLNP